MKESLLRLFRRPVDFQLLFRLIALVSATWMIVACLWVMLGRFNYPHDLEWMTGAELDHIERFQKGLPIYAPPTSDWIPFLYPPLYYILSALLAGVTHDLRASARLISLMSTLLGAYFVWRIARNRGTSKTWAYFGVGAFFGAFPFVEYWYDCERADSLFTVILLGTLVLLTESEALWAAAVAGALFGVAFFVKQPAVLYGVAIAVAYFIRGKWKNALVLGAVTTTILVAGVRAFDARSDGWFSYYVIRMPRAHGMSLNLLPQLITDLSRAWLYTLATAMTAVWFFVRFKRGGREQAISVAFLAASFVSSCASRLHVGGWPNVLMFWTASAAIAIGVVGSTIERRWLEMSTDAWDVRRWANTILPLSLVLQCWQFGYDPSSHIPSHADGEVVARFDRRVRELEKKGEVLTMGVGHLTSTRHFHDAALFDVLYVEKRVPEAILNDIRRQRFAAIIIDNFDDLWLSYEPTIGDTFMRAVASHYFVAERIDPLLPPCILGFQIKPSWTLMPRPVPLAENGPMEPLIRQHLAEIAVAEARQAAESRAVQFAKSSASTEAVGANLVNLLYKDEVDAGEK